MFKVITTSTKQIRTGLHFFTVLIVLGIQSIPAKGWNLLWRIYGPTQDWYDRKWRPSEIELVE
jgi:hypothetical protein